MTKSRGFSIVLHDVHKGLVGKPEIQEKIRTLPWRQYVIAEEPYKHQEGSHIHIFLQLRNPVHFTSMLKIWCTWWKSGRVQVDVMRGSMAQATDYVNEERNEKDKFYDESPLIYLEKSDATKAQVESRVLNELDLFNLFDPFNPSNDDYLKAVNAYILQVTGKPPVQLMIRPEGGWVRQDP
jgi:hypothetical protein